MSWDGWLLFVGLEAALSLSPGPAVLFVVAQALRHGERLGLGASCGILLGNACWFALSGLGVVAALLALPWLMLALRWAGIAYVAWLGVKSLVSKGLTFGGGDGGDRAPPTFGTLVQRGSWLQLANPKALMFFTAILPGFVEVGEHVWPPALQIFVFGASSAAVEFVVLAGYSLAAARASERLRDPRFAQWLDRLAGLLLLAVAVWLWARD